jgi:hypothetical protein
MPHSTMLAGIGTLPNPPGRTWTSCAFHIDERGGMRRSTDRGATAGDLHAVLSPLQSLRIRGEFRLGLETGKARQRAARRPART